MLNHVTIYLSIPKKCLIHKVDLGMLFVSSCICIKQFDKKHTYKTKYAHNTIIVDMVEFVYFLLFSLLTFVLILPACICFDTLKFYCFLQCCQFQL